MRLLLVEDDSLMRKMLVKIIGKRYGDQVTFVEAADGVQGMEIYDAQDPFDLAIVDFEMPRANGYEVVSHIRVDKKDRALPILRCTSRHDRKTVTKMLEVGANDYLAKPFEPDRILGKIEAILARAERRKPRMEEVAAARAGAAPAGDGATLGEALAPAAGVAATAVSPAPAAAPASTGSAAKPEPVAPAPGASEEAAAEKKSSLRHGNVGSDVIDDTGDSTVYVDITKTGDDEEALDIGEEGFLGGD